MTKSAITRRQDKLALFSCAAICGLGMLAQAPQAHAAEAEASAGQVEEVIVTARRREENLQSVPVAVTAVSERQLTAQGVRSVYDLQRAAPGLTVSVTSSGTSRPAYGIRAQRAASTGIAFDPAVSVYFGEVANGRSAGTPQSLFDISSVQVLKGPQGTLFGRNTTGGAILITPNAPTSDFEGYLKVATGNFDLKDLEGVLNVPVSDRLQIRLAARYYKRDGYFHNVILNNDSFDEDNTSLRLTVRVKPTDNITSDFIATRYYSGVVGFQPKLATVQPVTASPANLPRLTAEFAATQALGYYEYRESQQAITKDDAKGLQNITTIDLGDNIGFLGSARIKNIAGYRKLKNYLESYVDATIFPITESSFFYFGDQFSNELQLQGENGNLDYIFGIYYFREAGDELNATRNNGVPPRNYNEYHGRNTSKSAFTHIDYDLAGMIEGLSLSAGFRITKDDRFINGFQRQQRAPALGPPAFTCTASTTGVPTPLAISDLSDRGNCSVITRESYTEPTWDVSVNWQIDDDHLVYVAHRHGYRAGAAALILAPVLRPEKVNDIEIGSKNTFDIAGRSARFNIDGYYGKYKNLQRQAAVLLNGTPVQANLNAGAGHIYGVEADFQVQLMEDLSLSGSYAYTRAVYDEYTNFNRNANCPTGCLVDESSAIFPYTPKHAVNLLATYDLPLPADSGTASVSLNYSWVSSQNASDNNTVNSPSTNLNGTPGPVCADFWCFNRAGGHIPSYGLWNLRAEWRRPLGLGVDIGVFVNNLADKKYRMGVFALEHVLGYRSEFVGPPRMYGVELKVPFGAAAR